MRYWPPPSPSLPQPTPACPPAHWSGHHVGPLRASCLDSLEDVHLPLHFDSLNLSHGGDEHSSAGHAVTVGWGQEREEVEVKRRWEMRAHCPLCWHYSNTHPLTRTWPGSALWHCAGTSPPPPSAGGREGWKGGHDVATADSGTPLHWGGRDGPVKGKGGQVEVTFGS